MNLIKNKLSSFWKELAKEKSLSAQEILVLINKGEIIKARQALIFYTDPFVFEDKVRQLLKLLDRKFVSDDRKKNFSYEFLLKFILDLSSFLPKWNLCNKTVHGSQSLSDKEIEKVVEKSKKVLLSYTRTTGINKVNLEKIRKLEAIRFKVEGVGPESKADEMSRNLIGNHILDYLERMEMSFKTSNIRRICELREKGKIPTEIGNDHSTNLEYTMWLGVSFVTTNPQLIDVAWELNPEKWTQEVDEILRSLYSPEEICNLFSRKKELINAVVEEITTRVTVKVVAENAKLLRPIFILNEGRKGLVCLQVNPLKNSDANAMVNEALFAYSQLKKDLQGIPNVVFKLPATVAGLEAARKLTAKGIGVTITVSFGLFQLMPFAEVISQGNAIVSYLVVMNGRLSSPVIDELNQTKNGRSKAGRLAGVAIAKKLYQTLYSSEDILVRRNVMDKLKIVVASLRDYEDRFPDIMELIGVPIITVFPNIRHAFDAKPRDIQSTTAEKLLEKELINELIKSEIFRQAYYYGDDNNRCRLNSPFYLTDNERVLAYPPVKHTLGQFCEYRIKTKKRIKQQMRRLCNSN